MDLVGKKLGKYEISEFLGQGGMASVYKAFQPGVERDVAIKVMHPHLASSDDFVERFMREARSSGKLHHPHIMPVIDCDSEAGVHYLVLNYISGGTLEELLNRQSPLPLDQAIQITSQIGEALAYAHQHGMIHRDIKPANIMFMKDDGNHALLADFGIARLQNESNAGLTMEGSVVGTPNYMSPEAAKGEQSDERSDIYSLGIVLYEMVTGKTPYQADTLYSFLMKQANDPLPSPSEQNSAISPELEAIIVKALEKEPKNRYGSASEFVAALQNLSSAKSGASTTSKASKAMNEPQEKKQRWPILALVGIGVIAVAAITTYLLLGIDSGIDGGTETGSVSVTDQTEDQETTQVGTESDEQAEPEQAEAEDSPNAADDAAEGDATEGKSEESSDATGEAEAEANPETDTDDETEDGADASLSTEEDSAEPSSEEPSGTDESNPDSDEAIQGDSDESDSEQANSEPAESEETEGANADESGSVADASAEPITIDHQLGQLQLQQGADGDTFDLGLTQVPLPPFGSHYELWFEDSAGTKVNAGQLAMNGNDLAFSGPIDARTLVDYSSVVISIEPDDDDSPDQMETVAFISEPPNELLLTSGTSDDAPVGAMDSAAVEALLTDARGEALIAVDHAGRLQDALDDDEFGGAKTHAEHVINILVGEESPDFLDYTGDGQTQNPGNGVGLLVYLAQVNDGVSAAEAAAGDAVDEELASAIATSSQLSEALASAVKTAQKIFAQDTPAESQPTSAQLQALVAQLESGLDLEGDGASLMAMTQSGADGAGSAGAASVFGFSIPMTVETEIQMVETSENALPAAGRFQIALVEAIPATNEISAETSAISTSEQTQTSFDCSSVSQIPTEECNAVVALYTATGGDNWVNNDGWLTTANPCDDWYGIECSGGHIHQIFLDNNELVGPIPPEMGDLTELSWLQLHANRLNDPIPPELGKLTQITTLRLEFNELTGSIPPELSNITELESLNLSENRLSGPIPSELGSFPNLLKLNLSYNDLSGTVPSELANLSTLQMLSINDTSLSGPLPTAWTNLENLGFFHLLNTELCIPEDADIQEWLLNIPDLFSLAVNCADETESEASSPDVGTTEAATEELETEEGGYGGGYGTGAGYSTSGAYGANVGESEIQYTSHYTLEVSALLPAGEGQVYEAWMTNADGALVSLGMVEVGVPSDERLTINGSTSEALLRNYEQVLITLRPEDAQPPTAASEIEEAIVYQGDYQLALLAALRMIYYPNELSSTGLLKAAETQMALASTHTGFSQIGIDGDDVAEAKRHTEHVLNILIGEIDGERIDYDRDGRAENPGDGIGAQTYVQAIADELNAAAQNMIISSEQLLAVDHLLASSLNAQDRIDEALDKADQVFAGDTVEEAQRFVNELSILLVQAQMGLDLDGNRVVDPMMNEGGLAAIGDYLQLLSEVPLFEVSAASE